MSELPTPALPSPSRSDSDACAITSASAQEARVSEGLASLPNQDNAMSDADLKRSMELDASFKRAIDDHHRIISKICFAWSNQRADREDLYQEIVYQLWKSYQTFKGDSELSTWIHEVAHRSAKRPFRRNKVEIELRDDMSDQPSTRRTEEGLSDRAFRLFQRLEQMDRSVLLLKMEGFKEKEIAAILGLTEKAVEPRMLRIRGIASLVK